METSYAFLQNSSAPTPHGYDWAGETLDNSASMGFFTNPSCRSYQSAFNSTAESISTTEFPANPELHSVIHIYEGHKASSPTPWNIPTPLIEPYDPIIIFPTSTTNSPFLPRNSSTGCGSIGSINSAGLSNSTLLRLSTSYARASPLSEQDRFAGSPIVHVTNAAEALRSSVCQFVDPGVDAPDGSVDNCIPRVTILQSRHGDTNISAKEGVQRLLSKYLLDKKATDSLTLSTFESIAEEQLGIRSVGSFKDAEKRGQQSRIRDNEFDSLTLKSLITMPYPQRVGEPNDKLARTKFGTTVSNIPFSAQSHRTQASSSKESSSKHLLSSTVRHQSRAVPKGIFTPSVGDAFGPLKDIAEKYSFTTAPVGMLRTADGNAHKYSLKTKFTALYPDYDMSIATKDKVLSPITKTYTNQIVHDSFGSIRLGEALLAKVSPDEYSSVIKRLLKVAMNHHDIDVVIHFTGKLVDLASNDSRISKEVTDYVRFLEEHGYVAKAAALLIRCVENHLRSADGNSFPEQLLLKALKLYESIGEYDSCYHLIECTVQQYTQPSFNVNAAHTKNSVSLDKYWRIVFFGAYLEMLQGNQKRAREIVSYLILNTREAGPVMVEYVELELKYGSFKYAFDYIFQYFLREEITYSPLSLLSFEVLMRGFPSNTRLIIGVLKKMISSCAVNDIRWKLKCLCALYCVRNNESEQALDLCFKALACAKDGVQWRIFVLIAKIYFIRSCEEGASNYWIMEMKEKLFNNLTQAYQAAPLKSRLFVTIERVHYYEYYGDIATALSLLLEAISANQKEWKYTLEYASILRRQNRLAEALESIAFSFTLGDNMNTGRLWAFYASTAQSINASSHYMVIRSAVYHCPKSADVWVEVARLFMNPVYNYFSLSVAEDALTKAVYYTPQYGDTYIEWLRLLVIQYLVYGTDISSMVRHCLCLCVDMKPTYGNLWIYCKTKTVHFGYCPVKEYDAPASISKSIIDCAFLLVINDIYQNLDLYKIACRERMERNDLPTDIVGALSIKPEALQKKTPTQTWYNFNTAIGAFDKLHAEALTSPLVDIKDKIDLIFGSDLVL